MTGRVSKGSSFRQEGWWLVLLALILVLQAGVWMSTRIPDAELWSEYFAGRTPKERIAILQRIVSRPVGGGLAGLELDALLRSEERVVREWLMSAEVSRATRTPAVQMQFVRCVPRDPYENGRYFLFLRLPLRGEMTRRDWTMLASPREALAAERVP